MLALVKGLSAHVEALTARVLLLGKENAELRVDNAGLRAKVGYRFVEFFGSTVARFVGGEGEASGAAFAAGVVGHVLDADLGTLRRSG